MGFFKRKPPPISNVNQPPLSESTQSQQNILLGFLSKKSRNNKNNQPIELILTSETETSPYNKTLTELMEYPRNKDKKYPLFFLVLMAKLVKSKADHEVGIFRVSASRSELEKLESDATIGEFSSIPNNPILISSALMSWLAKLREPIFPANLYKTACDNCDDIEMLQSIFEKMDSVHFNCLSYLCKYLSQYIIANCSVNKMTKQNIILVFSTRCIRTPAELSIMEQLSMGPVVAKIFTAFLDLYGSEPFEHPNSLLSQHLPEVDSNKT